MTSLHALTAWVLTFYHVSDIPVPLLLSWLALSSHGALKYEERTSWHRKCQEKFFKNISFKNLQVLTCSKQE